MNGDATRVSCLTGSRDIESFEQESEVPARGRFAIVRVVEYVFGG